MESPDLDRIRFVTHHFQDLQGLRYGVPMGLVALSGGVTAFFAGWPPTLLLLQAALVLVRVLGRAASEEIS